MTEEKKFDRKQWQKNSQASVSSFFRWNFSTLFYFILFIYLFYFFIFFAFLFPMGLEPRTSQLLTKTPNPLEPDLKGIQPFINMNLTSNHL